METIQTKTGPTKPENVKKLLRMLANAIDSKAAIIGGMERTSNEITCHFTIGTDILSINIQSMEG